MNQSTRNIFIVFIVGWVIINSVQSVFLDLSADEAYYFVYSRELQWGYFDHPPVVAFLIKLGCFLSNSSWGVRFPFVLLSGFSVLLLFKLVEVKKTSLFFQVVLSMFLFHLFGFQALPDVPLIFLSLTFLLLFKNYLKKDSYKVSLLLALNIALLFLTKYYGVLLVVLSFLSSIQLLRRTSFWMIFVLSLTLLVPHFKWHLENDFVSFLFHLSERNWKSPGYSVLNTAKYIMFQPLIIGPFIGFFMLWGVLKYKVKNQFERTLIFILFGTYLFFLILTFTGGEVLPHWTIITVVPVTILGIKYFDEHVSFFKKPIKYIFIVSIGLIGMGRVLLIYDFIPQSLIKHEAVNGAAQWAKEIKEKADGYPVVFMNTYEDASRYMFYSGDKSLSIGNVMHRRTAFDFMPIDTNVFGKKIFLIPNWKRYDFSSFKTSEGIEIHYKFIDNFVYYPLVKIAASKNKYEVKANSKVAIPIRVINKSYSNEQLATNPNHIPTLWYCIFKNGQAIIETLTDVKVVDIQNSESYFSMEIKTPKDKGKYILKFGVSCNGLTPTHNSTTITLLVK